MTLKRHVCNLVTVKVLYEGNPPNLQINKKLLLLFIAPISLVHDNFAIIVQLKLETPGDRVCM